jgi:hypothetical protein
MASALDTIAHVILPNVMKLKGAATLVSGLERRDVSPFAQVWTNTGLDHTPQVVAKERDVWRVGVLSMPKPSEMGEAHMVAFVAKKNDAGVARYFTLEYDFVLKTGQQRTIIKEKDGANFTKRGNEGPPITGDFQVDASAFIDAIKRIIDPLPSEQPPPRDWS